MPAQVHNIINKPGPTKTYYTYVLVYDAGFIYNRLAFVYKCIGSGESGKNEG